MSAPAGWYPDPVGAPGQRWWDGTQWTAHPQGAVPPAATPTYAPAAPYAPFGMLPKVAVETNTVWVWLAVAASAVPFFTLFLIDWNGYVDAITRSVSGPAYASTLIQWQLHTLAVSLVSWAAMALFIVFAWLDWRELRRRGVPGPFHWAWSFFALAWPGAAVYMIGRTVVLRRRTVSGGWAPLWVWIGVTVGGYLITFVWVFSAVGSVFTRLAGVYA